MRKKENTPERLHNVLMTDERSFESVPEKFFYTIRKDELLLASDLASIMLIFILLVKGV